jgi:hypothetical protein
VCALPASSLLQAAEQAATPARDSADSPRALPDWGGLWELSFNPAAAAPEPPSFTPEYARKLKQFESEQARGGHQDAPSANCVPPGMPAIMMQPYPIELLMTPGKITIAIEAFSQMRRVFMDGRGHPAKPDATFNGHSVGRWEGRTLVIDTVGVTTDVPISFNWGMRHSEQMRIEERISTTDADTMQLRTTITDPLALTKPYVSTQTLKRHRDWDIAEYVCEQNNRNYMNAEGKAGIDLSH